MNLRLIGASLLLVSTVASAQSMSANDFLARAEPLLSKSKIELLFSSDARSLLQVVGETAQRTRARLDAERSAGRQPTTCLPPKGKAQINAQELIQYVRRLPPAQRARSFDEAFSGYAARKYPCRA